MLILNTEQKAKVTVKPLTAKGNPALVDGQPGWYIDDVSVASIIVSPDGMSADVIATGIGNAIITVAADADLTSGVSQVTGSLNVTVKSADAFSLLLESDIPTLN